DRDLVTVHLAHWSRYRGTAAVGLLAPDPPRQPFQHPHLVLCQVFGDAPEALRLLPCVEAEPPLVRISLRHVDGPVGDDVPRQALERAHPPLLMGCERPVGNLAQALLALWEERPPAIEPALCRNPLVQQ